MYSGSLVSNLVLLLVGRRGAAQFEFAIIGAQKAGTTGLRNALALDHPSTCVRASTRRSLRARGRAVRVPPARERGLAGARPTGPRSRGGPRPRARTRRAVRARLRRSVPRVPRARRSRRERARCCPRCGSSSRCAEPRAARSRSTRWTRPCAQGALRGACAPRAPASFGALVARELPPLLGARPPPLEARRRARARQSRAARRAVARAVRGRARLRRRLGTAHRRRRAAAAAVRATRCTRSRRRAAPARGAAAAAAPSHRGVAATNETLRCSTRPSRAPTRSTPIGRRARRRPTRRRRDRLRDGGAPAPRRAGGWNAGFAPRVAAAAASPPTGHAATAGGGGGAPALAGAGFDEELAPLRRDAARRGPGSERCTSPPADARWGTPG